MESIQMSLWAQLDENNKVINVLVGDNNLPDEGYQWLIDNLGGTWIKTQESVIGGVHYNSKGEPDNKPTFRKNTAAIDGYYVPDKDAFILPKPHASWILNEETCSWEAPTLYPENNDDKLYYWDEATLSWLEYTVEN